MDEHGTAEHQHGPYCRVGGTVPMSDIMSSRNFSRRGLFRGAGALAGGMALAAAGAGGLGGSVLGAPQRALAASTGKCLVLYDASGPYGWIGDVHSKLLTNLLGRFLPAGATTNTNVRKPITQYVAGDTENYDATFYMGSVYGSAIPASFKTDILATAKPIVWFKYNVEQLAWGDSQAAFQAKFGLTYFGLTQKPTYTTVAYKGKSLLRNTIDPEISWMDPTNPALASAPAVLVDTAGGFPLPYVTKGSNFWYVADIPFAYMSEEDRYIAMADLLFDMIGVAYTPTRRGLVRIEDVSAADDPAELRAIADYLYSQGVPFTVATIPFYKDPTGIFNGGVPMSISLSSNAGKPVAQALQYMKTKGGEIVMHGTTHQYSNVPNPYNGVSADDYEFFRVTENADHSLTYVGPIPGDSANWCTKILNQGLQELSKAKLGTPIGFEAPHYAASAVDYGVMASKFSRTYHRALYFQDAPVTTAATSVVAGGATTRNTAKKTAKGRQAVAGARSAPRTVTTSVMTTSGLTTTTVSTLATPTVNFGGQFFPYVIGRDIYRNKVLPENLGNIEPQGWPDPVLGPYPMRLPADIIRAADKNLAVRDAYASFFFHPFWDIQYLKDTVAGIKGLGYTFVKASTL